MKRPCTEVMLASALADVRGRLSRVLQMIDLNAGVCKPSRREIDRSDRVLEALAALRAANELTEVSL